MLRGLKNKILVTGGLGFIGSNTSLKLLEKDYDLIILDNLSNSKIEVEEVIRSLINKDFEFIEGDIILISVFLKNYFRKSIFLEEILDILLDLLFLHH